MGNSNNSSTSATMSSSLQSTISSADIVFFQTTTCPYCQQARDALKAAGKEFKIVNVDSQQRSELQSLTTSSSVPSIWVKGKFVGGCNDGPESWMGIRKLISNGKLDELLKA